MIARRIFLLAAAAVICLVASLFHPVYAGTESCSASRDYLLGGLAGELPQTPRAYKTLFDVCIATAGMSNVKDAFLLRDVAIGVIPKQDNVTVTANMLSDFCQRFPKATLRFITRAEQAKAKSVALTVLLPATSSTPCSVIRGISNR